MDPWSAAAGCLEPINGSTDKVATLKCLPVVFGQLVSWALIFAGVVALFFIIFAGFRYMNSGGDPKQVGAAQQTLTWAIIGLLLIFFSFFIINFISYFTGVDCIRFFGFDNCT